LRPVKQVALCLKLRPPHAQTIHRDQTQALFLGGFVEQTGFQA